MRISLLFKIYIIIIALISVAFLGLNILVQAQTPPPSQDLNFCTKVENISLATPIVISCSSNYHIEGQGCVSNIGGAVTLPTGGSGASCNLSTGSAVIASDNCFQFYLNGTKIGESASFGINDIRASSALPLSAAEPETCDPAWNTPYTYSSLNYSPGINVIAFKATDYGGPYGLAAQFKCGINEFLTTNNLAAWKCSAPQNRGSADPAGWYNLTFDDSSWTTPSSVSSSLWSNFAPAAGISVPLSTLNRIWSNGKYGADTNPATVDDTFMDQNKKIFCRVSFQGPITQPTPPVTLPPPATGSNITLNVWQGYNQPVYVSNVLSSWNHSYIFDVYLKKNTESTYTHTGLAGYPGEMPDSIGIFNLNPGSYDLKVEFYSSDQGYGVSEKGIVGVMITKATGSSTNITLDDNKDYQSSSGSPASYCSHRTDLGDFYECNLYTKKCKDSACTNTNNTPGAAIFHFTVSAP